MAAVVARVLTPAAASGRTVERRPPAISSRASHFASRARLTRSLLSSKVTLRDGCTTKASLDFSKYYDEEPKKEKEVDELQMARFGQEYEAQNWPKWEKLKSRSMVAPSSRQRKAMGRKLKKMGARDVMSAYDWEKLTFMRDGWELRTVEPRAAVPKKGPSQKEIRSWETYKKLKEELVADTSVMSGFVLVCLILLDLEVNTCASFSVGALFAVLYVRLLSAEVDNLKSGDQVIAEVGTDAQWDPMKMAAPLRMALPPILIAMSINFEVALSNFGIEHFYGVDSIPLMPALGGFAMYKLAVVYQATRVAINDSVKRGLEQENRITSGDYIKYD